MNVVLLVLLIVVVIGVTLMWTTRGIKRRTEGAKLAASQLGLEFVGH